MIKHLICGFAFVLVSCDSQTIKCNSAGKSKADEYTRWLFIFENPNRQFPEVNADFKEFCSETQKREKYVKDYAQKCYTGITKQSTGLLIYGIAKKNKYYCSSKRGNNDMITVGKCLNKIRSTAKQCMDTLFDNYIGILNAETKMRIPQMCCSYYKYEECGQIHAVKYGTNICSENAQKLLDELFSAYTGDIVKFLCGDYDRDNDKCAKIVAAKKKPSQKKPSSMLEALVNVLDSL